MTYDSKRLRWFARLSRPDRLEAALEADSFRREAVRDLNSGHLPGPQSGSRAVAPRWRLPAHWRRYRTLMEPRMEEE